MKMHFNWALDSVTSVNLFGAHAYCLFPYFSFYLNSNFLSWWNQVRNKYSGKVYIVAESRLSAIHNPKEKPKEAVVSNSKDVPKNTNAKTKGASGGKTENVLDSFKVLEKVSGSSLVGTKWAVLPSTALIFYICLFCEYITSHVLLWDFLMTFCIWGFIEYWNS